MSQSSLKMLIFGIDVKVADRLVLDFVLKGIDADSLAVSNTPESDIAIGNIVDSKDWDRLIVGNGVRQDHK
jgi:hypothetical protein